MDNSIAPSLNTNTAMPNRLPIIVRAYAPPPPTKEVAGPRGRNRRTASEWTLIFDTETTTDAAQRLRFGTYQVRRGAELFEAGAFFDPQLPDDELSALREYAAAQSLRLLAKHEFVDDVFFGIGYDLRATIVGFNLPFDISRLAVDHGPARGKVMRGGFSFRLSEDRYKPRVQVKHISARAAWIQFTKPRPRSDTKRMRRKGFPAAEASRRIRRRQDHRIGVDRQIVFACRARRLSGDEASQACG